MGLSLPKTAYNGKINDNNSERFKRNWFRIVNFHRRNMQSESGSEVIVLEFKPDRQCKFELLKRCIQKRSS
jgi:hypothetical protein